MSALIEVQYNIFESREQSEKRALLEHIAQIEESLGKVRRGTYARIGEQTKRILELESRMEVIEHNICRGIKNEA